MARFFPTRCPLDYDTATNTIERLSTPLIFYTQPDHSYGYAHRGQKHDFQQSAMSVSLIGGVSYNVVSG